MSDLTEQRLGYGFGLLGGLLIALGGLISLAVGAADFVLGRPTVAMGAMGAAVVLFVIGALAIFFAWLGRRTWSDRPLASGVLLVVLAFVSWVAMGVGADLLALVGTLFVVLSGVLYLIEPAKKAAHAVVSAA